MKICFALLYYDPAHSDPEHFFEWARVTRYLPQALAARGHEVDVVIQFASDHVVKEGGVSYRFVTSGRFARMAGRCAGMLLHRDVATMEPALRAARAVREINPDIIHLHGTNLYLNHQLLLQRWSTNAPSVVMQHHGGDPSPNRMARAMQRRNFSSCSKFLFTTIEQAQPFVDAGLIASDRVVPFMETSSQLRPRERVDARRETGMRGSPVILWAGRLDANKDPITALRGLEAAVSELPDARMYFYYLEAGLLSECREFVNERPLLQDRVRFCGRVSFDAMEAVYNSADILIQASHREHSGVAVLDAMACGVIPVVTDISSFRSMTDVGRVGALFPPEDSSALARCLLAIPVDRIEQQSRNVRNWFEQRLSFEALARKLDGQYREVIDEARRPPE